MPVALPLAARLQVWVLALAGITPARVRRGHQVEDDKPARHVAGKGLTRGGPARQIVNGRLGALC